MDMAIRPTGQRMAQGLSIRKKVALTLSLPILALGALAAIGFAGASNDLSSAQKAASSAQTYNDVHAVARAVGSERLAFLVSELPDRADPEGDAERIEAASEATEVLLAGLPVANSNGVGVSSGGLNNVRSALIAARSTPVSRSTNFSRAASALLDEAVGLGIIPSSAAAQQDRINLSNLHRWIEATEVAWGSFAQRDSEDLRPTAEVLEAFARADALMATLLGAPGATGVTIEQMLAATVVLEELKFTAVEDLLNPSESVVTPEAAVLTLADSRARWVEAAELAEVSTVNQLRTASAFAESRRNQFGLFGLFAMLAFGMAGLMLYHSVTAPISATTAAARHTIGERLPAILESLRDPEGTPVRPARVQSDGSDDELADLVQAVNDVQDDFYDIAHQNALGRERVAQRTVALSRKNARLLHDLVRHVASWRTADLNPEIRQRLFQIDHLATRMQRNVEASILLSGAHSERQWTHPVTATTTARLALGEVGAFDRVDIVPSDGVRLKGNSAPDIAHILAELIENALNAADPAMELLTQRVRVECVWVSAGLAFTVHDGGVGLSDERRADINQRLHTPYEAHEGPTRNLGLYVVAFLAKRYGIDVRMLEGPNGGTVVRVVLPVDLVDPATVPRDRKPIDAGRGVTVGVQAAKANDRPVQTVEQENAADQFFGSETGVLGSAAPSGVLGSAAPSGVLGSAAPSGLLGSAAPSALVSPLGGNPGASTDLSKLVGGAVPPPVVRENRPEVAVTTAAT